MVRVSDQESRNTKENLLSAAIDLFSENGYSAVSVREITRRAGVKESALYNHYRNKDELLEVILSQFRDEFGQRTFPLETLEEQVDSLEPELFFQHHLLSLREKITPRLQKIWKIVYLEQFRDRRAREFVLNEIIGRPAHYYAQALRLMMERGKIRQQDPRLLADEYNYGLMAMSIERMLRQTDGEDVAAVVGKMMAHIKFFCDALKPER